jgi:hypothetical protein
MNRTRKSNRLFALGALILSAGLAIGLSGCDPAGVYAAATGATVEPQVAQTLVDSYGIAESAGTAYITSCHALRGTAQACNRTTEQKVFSDLRIYGQNRDAVLKLIRANNGGAIPVLNYNTLVTAYDGLKADLAANGVKAGS